MTTNWTSDAMRAPRPRGGRCATSKAPEMDPITRGHACGRHLNRVLEEMHWDLDHIRVYDLKVPAAS